MLDFGIWKEEAENDENICCVLYSKNRHKFWSILRGHFIEQKSLISKEWWYIPLCLLHPSGGDFFSSIYTTIYIKK